MLGTQLTDVTRADLQFDNRKITPKAENQLHQNEKSIRPHTSSQNTPCLLYKTITNIAALAATYRADTHFTESYKQYWVTIFKELYVVHSIRKYPSLMYNKAMPCTPLHPLTSVFTITTLTAVNCHVVCVLSLGAVRDA